MLGKLKLEETISHGSVVALAPKCYSLKNNDDDSSKRALKGIKDDLTVSHDDFIEKLYECHTEQNVLQHRFMFNKKSGAIELIAQTKKALNSIYTKHHTLPNLVSIRPHKRNGEFL